VPMSLADLRERSRPSGAPARAALKAERGAGSAAAAPRSGAALIIIKGDFGSAALMCRCRPQRWRQSDDPLAGVHRRAVTRAMSRLAMPPPSKHGRTSAATTGLANGLTAAARRAINVIYVTFLGRRRSPADTPGLPWTLTDNDRLRTAPVMGLRPPARGYTLQERERGPCLRWRADSPRSPAALMAP